MKFAELFRQDDVISEDGREEALDAIKATRKRHPEANFSLQFCAIATVIAEINGGAKAIASPHTDSSPAAKKGKALSAIKVGANAHKKIEAAISKASANFKIHSTHRPFKLIHDGKGSAIRKTESLRIDEGFFFFRLGCNR